MEAASAKSWRVAETGSGAAVGCAEFLEDHAAFMDGCLSDGEAAAHQAHAQACASCARYARVLDRGLRLVRELPQIEPSAHFEERLRHRIFHLEDEARQKRGAGRSVAGLAAAATIAAIAWSPLMWRAASQDGGAAEAGIMSTVSGLAPHVESLRDDWYVQPVSSELDQVPVQRLVGYVGSYSPLIVSPPAYARGPRAVRLVSAQSQ